MSEEKPFDEVQYGKNPFTGRAQAKEETARDLDKDPRQLLTDVHEESLTPRTDFIARTLARMASMQLRVQREVESQSAETHKLNESIRRMTKIILAFTIVAGVAACLQVYFAWKASNSTSKPMPIQLPTK